MYAVRNEDELLVFTEDLEFAEAYAYDYYNRMANYVEVVDYSTCSLLMSLGSFNHSVV